MCVVPTCLLGLTHVLFGVLGTRCSSTGTGAYDTAGGGAEGVHAMSLVNFINLYDYLRIYDK